MKQEAIFNQFTPLQIEKFRHTQPGGEFNVNRVKYTVHETPFEEHPCELCAFKIIGEKCPKQAAEKTPVCFANKRPDKCSVYFVKNQKKILVWTQD